MGTTAGTENMSPEMEALIAEKVAELMAAKDAEKAAKPSKMTIIATKGTLDWAYPPLILASTAAALGWEVGMFFTFYGLDIIHKTKHKKLAIAPFGNPALPMPIPMPNILGTMPGMTKMGTMFMKHMFKSKGVASIEELLEMCVEMDVKMWPCGMTIEVFGYGKDDFIDGVAPVCGAAHFVEYAADADVSLYI